VIQEALFAEDSSPTDYAGSTPGLFPKAYVPII